MLCMCLTIRSLSRNHAGFSCTEFPALVVQIYESNVSGKDVCLLRSYRCYMFAPISAEGFMLKTPLWE